MTDKLFDSFIQQKLKHFESEVPSDMWNRINTKNKNKKRALFWWTNKTFLLSFFALIIIGVSYTFLLDINTQNHLSKQQQNENGDSQKNIANNFSPEKNINTLEKKNIINKNNKADTKKVNEIADNKSIESVNNYEIVSNKKALNQTKVEFNFKANGNLEKFNSNRDIQKNAMEIGLTDFSEKKVPNSNYLTKNNRFYKSQTNNAKYSNYESNNNKLGIVNKFSKNYIEKDINTNVVASNSKLLMNTAFKNVETISLNNFFRNDNCPSAKGSIRNDFYLEAFISPDLTFKKVISTESGINDYLIRKDSIEIMRGGFSLGARISKNISNKLLLKTGIQFSQVNEKFSLKTENDRRQTIVINSHTIIRPGQSDTTISDTSIQVQVGYRVQSNMNYYRNIEVPILISYELDNANSKWTMAINGGAIVNLTSWYEGRTIDARNNIVSINSKMNNTFYKQNIGLSLYAGLSFIYKLNNKLDLFAEPYARFSLNNIESKEGFNQRFNAVGLQLGTRINFNNKNNF